MAKHVVLESYTFTPSTNTIVVNGKFIRREQLLLITNVTRGIVVYNFSDPTLQAASVTNTISASTGLETTTIVLNYATTSQSSTDKISILVEETYNEIVPAETYMDPVGKMRVSTPQSLIDTDFEYGLQPTKWESINLLNNRPTCFYDITQPIPITTMTSSTTTVTVVATTYTSSSTGVAATSVVTTVQGLASTAGLYPGMFIQKVSGTGAFGGITQILSVDSATQITILSQSANTTGTLVFSPYLPTAGQPLFIQGSLDVANCDGWWICASSTSGTATVTFTTLNNTTMVGGTLLDATKTYMYIGTFYTGAVIPAGTSAFAAIASSSCTVTTTYAHGLQPGNHIFLTGVGTVTALTNTPQIVVSTPTNNTFTFATSQTGTPTSTLNATFYPRPTGYVVHRAWDGGAQFSNANATHGYQIIRQTRRYFRYQSGKGIQFSTGSIVKPMIWPDTISASGTTITVTCKFPHGLSANAQIQVQGSNDTAYNGIFTVVTAPTVLSFTYTALTTPTTTPAPGFPIYISPYSWYGARNRIGMFDTQNGMFFEYDGQNMYAVKRSSTYQLSGTIAVNTGVQAVTGTNTQFSKQLAPMDYIVIRGMSYMVLSIISDTSMIIYPEYRGTTNMTNAIVSKTIDTKFIQSSWNIDKSDGTGYSGYNLDLTKMQMFYIDYSWYGAGEIRYGFRNTRGEVMYAHRIPNNNLNFLAWMRSGNMCGRYETNTITYNSILTATLSSASGAGSTIGVSDHSIWPSSGTAFLVASGATAAAIEYITYTSKSQAASLSATLVNGSTTVTMTSTTGVSVGQYIVGTGIYPGTTVLSITTNASIVISQAAYIGGTQTLLFGPTLVIGARAQTGGATTAQTFTYSATAPIQVSLYSPQVASTINHWGSSVMMDGRYDDDKSLVFNVGMNQGQQLTNLALATRYALISLRVSPSVDSSTTGLLGSREVINRMQLVLRQMDVYSTATFRIDVVLNGYPSSGVFAPVGGSSLAQYCIHTGPAVIAGGESIFSFFTNTTGVTQQDLTLVRDIGTNILGGGTSLTVPTYTGSVAVPVTGNARYPDGPDIITICCSAVSSATNAINARVSWTEAQA